MKCTLTLFILFLIQTADAQDSSTEKAFLSSRCSHQFLSLSARRTNKKFIESFPFREIKVLDYRPDTLRMGLFSERQHCRDLRFDAKVAPVIQSYLNETYSNPLAAETLLVIIKDLWFSDIVYEPDVTPSKFRSHIRFRVETYIKESTSYIPLTYFDTLISSKKVVAEIAPFTLPDLLSAFIDKINSVSYDRASIGSKRRLSFSAIDSFSNRIFRYPINTADTLKKGVYASLEEFKDNKPSVFNYEIDKDDAASTSLRLIDEQGKSYYSRKMWGYCDGQQTYVMMDGNLFPIINYGRAFYVYGSKEYHVKKNSVPIFLLFPAAYLLSSVPLSETVNRNLRFFKLDIVTGEIQ